MRKYIFTLLLALTAVGYAAGQTPPDYLWKWHFERGDALYKSAKYIEAYEEFLKASNIRGEMCEVELRQLDFQLAMSAYRGGKAGAKELLYYYLETYPESVWAYQAQFALGNICFDDEEYSEALVNYLAVNSDRLPAPERDEYNFKTGYCYFVLEEYDRTQPYMAAIGFKSPYYVHAQYCLGYASYRRGDYADAKQYFMSISDSEAYAKVLPFYMMQIEFSEGNYHYVTENGAAVLRTATGARAMELERMIGEAWFQISSWSEAAQYLMEYEKQGGEMDRQVNYMIGFSQYMMEDWKRAEQYLSRVPGPDDRLSQNASYHLADVYLGQGDKSRAMQSFSIASTRGYDNNIAEDALFNYGKLQYELGGGYFNEAINVLNRYLTLYPSSPRVPQVKEYLAAAYYNSRNFDAAYKAITAMPNPDNNVKAALQKISYFRALEHYQTEEYDEAWSMLDESLLNRYNAKYTALAGYWQGEILYKQGNYEEALKKWDTYMRLSPKSEPENVMARYNSGYAYFSMEQWVSSKENFDNFLLEYPTKDSYRADAFNRMGDIEFSRRQFWRAIEYYDEAAKLNTPQHYYSAFQRAMVLGMVDRSDRKIESLTDIMQRAESPYTADATYELGREYIARQKYREAANTLEYFTKTYPTAPQYVPALLDLGLVYQNLKDNKRSLEYYKMVVEREKQSPAARDAMNSIRGIYVDENDVDAYFAYAKSVGIETDLGTVQRDSLAFASAQRVYLSGDRAKATDALNAYMKGYPNGAYFSDALYYAGENALARGEKEEAYRYFTQQAEKYNNSYTLRALEMVGEIGTELKDYRLAADAYHQLSYMAATSSKREEALAGYLNATMLEGDSGEIERVTNDVIKRTTDNALKRKAMFARAKALEGMGEQADAVKLYAALSADVSDAEGAEAAYRVIEDAYKNGDSSKAEKLVFDFAEKNTPYAYWLGKAFITLGDIYAAAGDSFQARATYQSILDGYSDTKDGIVEEAAARIKNMK